jgi:hypothetical protein
MNLARKPRDEKKRVPKLRLGKYWDSSTNIGPIPYNSYPYIGIFLYNRIRFDLKFSISAAICPNLLFWVPNHSPWRALSIGCFCLLKRLSSDKGIKRFVKLFKKYTPKMD